jgi:hypothetical protein
MTDAPLACCTVNLPDEAGYDVLWVVVYVVNLCNMPS